MPTEDPIILSNDTLDLIKSTSENVDLAFIAYLNDARKTIIFSAKTEKLLGYTPEELNGRSFYVLIPESLHDKHEMIVENLAKDFKKDRASQIRKNETPTVNKAGEVINISVTIGAHPIESSFLFIALLQDPAIIATKADLKSAHILIDSMLAVSVVDRVKKSRAAFIAALTKRVAARGGILSFVIWLLTQITPLGTSIKGFLAAWQWDNGSELSKDKRIGVYEKIDDEDRLSILKRIRNSLSDLNSEVIAAAYYTVAKQGKDDYLVYRSDSEGFKGEEVYFQPKQLTDEEYDRLLSLDCVLKKNLGYLPNRSSEHERVYFDGILCPTVIITKDEYGLAQYTFKGIVAVALEPLDKDSEGIEPIATYLFNRGAGLENIYPSEEK